MDLTNEYDQLLNYLEEHLSEERGSKEKVNEKSKEPLVHNFKIEEDQNKKEKKKVEEETKRLIEECKDLYKDQLVQKSGSDGFDITRYEKFLRARLIEDYKKSQSYERPYIGVLEVVANCIRKVYYERSKYQVDIKKLFTFPYLYLIQKVGDVVHECISDIYDFSEVNKTIVSEMYKVKGKIDALKESNVYEMKTVDYDKFTGYYVDEHYYQGNVYAYILNNEYNYNIKNVTLIYQFRDKLKSKPVPFDLPVNNELAKNLLSRAPILLDGLSKRQPPDVIGSTIEQCTYCLFKQHCENQESKIGQPFLKKQDKKKIDTKKPVFLL